MWNLSVFNNEGSRAKLTFWNKNEDFGKLKEAASRLDEIKLIV